MTDLIKIIYEEVFYSSRVRTPEDQELRTAEEEFMEKLLPHLGAMLMMELFPPQHRVQ